MGRALPLCWCPSCSAFAVYINYEHLVLWCMLMMNLGCLTHLPQAEAEGMHDSAQPTLRIFGLTSRVSASAHGELVGWPVWYKQEQLPWHRIKCPLWATCFCELANKLQCSHQCRHKNIVILILGRSSSKNIACPLWTAYCRQKLYMLRGIYRDTCLQISQETHSLTQPRQSSWENEYGNLSENQKC